MRIAAAFAVAVIGTAGHAQPASMDVATAKRYFGELRQLGAADGGKVWGRRVSGPMMFVDPSTKNKRVHHNTILRQAEHHPHLHAGGAG